MMNNGQIVGHEVGAFREKFEDRLRRIRMECRPALAQKAEKDAPWFAICVSSGRENDVEKALTDADVDALVPMRKGPRRKRRGRILPPRDEVLMVGYVLVRCVYSTEAMAAFFSFEHVVDVLGGWEKPFAIDHEKVCNIMMNADNGNFDWERLSAIVVKAGDRVRIADGLFAGQVGEVITPNSRGKGDVVVEVDMFGQMTPINLPLAILEDL